MKRLAPIVHSLLESMLQKEKIEYLNVMYRIKSSDEAIKKIKKKQYENPQQQLTDLSGIRIVTFLESQVTAINKLIRELFEVDDKNSLDRANILGLDRLGYRSTHFVCTLGEQRARLPEYDALGSLKFEIQVRTVLQHAWAELAHDRSFKFSVSLPTKIERKLNLYSGMLEIVDDAFDEISREIDNYKKSLESKSLIQLTDAELDSISLKRFLDEMESAQKLSLKIISVERISDEMKQFGISTIGELQKLATPGFFHDYKEHMHDGNGGGFLRLMIMYDDIDRYFESTKSTWRQMPREAFKLLSSKYGDSKVRRLLSKHGKKLEGDDNSENSSATNS